MRFTTVRLVDTNVLLYAISRDPREQDMARVANDILDSSDIGLSTQVLQEFYVQATRTSRSDALTHPQAAALVDAFSRFAVQDVTMAIVRAAMTTRVQFRLSYWAVRTSKRLACSVVVNCCQRISRTGGTMPVCA